MNGFPQLEGVVYDGELPVIDHEQLDMLLMADEGEDAKALVSEIFEIFKTEGSEKLSQLDEVCKNGELLEFRNIIHFVAGSAGNLGLLRLNAFYRGIEEAIDSDRFTPTEGCTATIRAEFDLACDAFVQELL